MEITIKPEDIDTYLRDALVKSTVGKTIALSIQKELDSLFTSYRSPIKEFVQDHLKRMVKEHMEKQDVKPLLVAAIEKHLTPETISLIVSNGLYELQKNMNDRN